MENKMTIFANKEFGRIRTINDENGGALFCAKDVCDASGYDQVRKAVQRHVDEETVRNIPSLQKEVSNIGFDIEVAFTSFKITLQAIICLEWKRWRWESLPF